MQRAAPEKANCVTGAGTWPRPGTGRRGVGQPQAGAFLNSSTRRSPSAAGTGDEHARRRLALTRVLIWAEREAHAMEMAPLAERLRDAIGELHPDAGEDGEP